MGAADVTFLTRTQHTRTNLEDTRKPAQDTDSESGIAMDGRKKTPRRAWLHVDVCISFCMYRVLLWQKQYASPMSTAQMGLGAFLGVSACSACVLIDPG